ncbi:acyl-CoA thioesterase [Rhodovulum sulfidophilum]|uniref:Acyl-CoA hydrolase n=1 Tax=Rhodovulum sulfidophilum TaxID=35806 RepID=A0A0D6B7R8_RHOSU|nr:acyl-CoA thioesterase [Rhodovulum sulfidophilum]ANB32947.1 acyl-CoA thioesterase [Rhodovulum sulfidophilum DSM 1374]ANB36796.1 acyl-CoA thioesterase [Rhodovulum sulfidophilum]MBL3553271.1 acyl-CoA thioesterase [Rhodovulum sulfidophilum]MBL3559294.1 acyl-CoA thioesterase [Rhodovulum sulfidophilum]MBL3565132.1 acyl-CoA thioesterase [Rhodovulum sulfidophilum]
MTALIFPETVNPHGTLFAGAGLAMMSKAAFLVASRRARRTVVMAGSEKIDFRTPVLPGEALELTAVVTRIGRSSMSVEVTGEAETLTTGARHLAMTGRFEMVAVDENGRPTPIAIPKEEKTQ